MPTSIWQRPLQALDAVAFSGVWAGLTAGALTWAAGTAIAPRGELPGLAWACGLAMAGTVVVYSVDRLRDVERDAATSPARTAFVSRHRAGLLALVGLAAVGGGVAALQLPASTWWLCAGVAAVGLLHRRLKVRTGGSVLYVTGAWVAVVVGLPALLAVGIQALPLGTLLGTAVGLGLAIASNVIASDLRGLRFDAGTVLALRRSRQLALGGAGAPLLVPGLAGLAMVGACAWLSVVFFRPGERHGLVVVDGALLVGGGAAALLLGAG